MRNSLIRIVAPEMELLAKARVPRLQAGSKIQAKSLHIGGSDQGTHCIMH